MSSKSIDVATTIAVATFAFCLAGVTVVLGIIAIRDGSNPLVSQSMQELVAIGGASILALGAVAGLKKWLETGSNNANNNNSSSGPSSDPAGFSASPLGIAASDVAAILAAAGAQVASAPAAAPADTAVPAAAATAGA